MQYRQGPVQIEQAADALLTRRINNTITARLAPALRPQTLQDAFAIQQAVVRKMADKQIDSVGGWKCALPDADKLIASPIFASTVYNQSPCPIKLDNGVCKIEPEIAFRFEQDLPARAERYSDEQIVAALGNAYLALELIQSRYLAPDEVSYLEHLADGLFNQGVFLGPEISLEQAFVASEINFTLHQSVSEKKAGQHPNQFPQRPLFWLVNFLRQRGIDVKAGQVVITGSYAGVMEVQPDVEFSLQYGELGSVVAILLE
ncbi:hypothetical protein [Neptunomonas sp.]|uniref:hypothetical protein n=1 Tax=Neptunomonas sp. TaxID=1971898 RepID=UPI0035622B22